MNKLILLSICTVFLFVNPVCAADSGNGIDLQGLQNNTDIYSTVNNWFNTIQQEVYGFIDTENFQAEFGNYLNTSNIGSTINSDLQNIDVQAYLTNLTNNQDIQSLLTNPNLQSIANNTEIQSFINSLKLKTVQN